MGPRGMRIGNGEGSTMRNFIVCTVRVIRSTRLKWAEHLVGIEEGRYTFKILTGKPTRNIKSKHFSLRI